MMLRITNYFPSIYMYFAANSYIMAQIIKILINVTLNHSCKERPLMGSTLCQRREETLEVIPIEGLFHLSSHLLFLSSGILLS